MVMCIRIAKKTKKNRISTIKQRLIDTIPSQSGVTGQMLPYLVIPDARYGWSGIHSFHWVAEMVWILCHPYHKRS